MPLPPLHREGAVSDLSQIGISKLGLPSKMKTSFPNARVHPYFPYSASAELAIHDAMSLAQPLVATDAFVTNGVASAEDVVLTPNEVLNLAYVKAFTSRFSAACPGNAKFEDRLGLILQEGGAYVDDSQVQRALPMALTLASSVEDLRENLKLLVTKIAERSPSKVDLAARLALCVHSTQMCLAPLHSSLLGSPAIVREQHEKIVEQYPLSQYMDVELSRALVNHVFNTDIEVLDHFLERLTTFSGAMFLGSVYRGYRHDPDMAGECSDKLKKYFRDIIEKLKQKFIANAEAIAGKPLFLDGEAKTTGSSLDVELEPRHVDAAAEPLVMETNALLALFDCRGAPIAPTMEYEGQNAARCAAYVLFDLNAFGHKVKKIINTHFPALHTCVEDKDLQFIGMIRYYESRLMDLRAFRTQPREDLISPNETFPASGISVN